MSALFGVPQRVTTFHFKKDFTLPGARDLTAQVNCKVQTYDEGDAVFEVSAFFYSQSELNAEKMLAHVAELSSAAAFITRLEGLVGHFRISAEEQKEFQANFREARDAERARAAAL